jgi:hypothetical protein
LKGMAAPPSAPLPSIRGAKVLVCGDACCPARSSIWCRELTFTGLWSFVFLLSALVVAVLSYLDYGQSIALSVLLVLGGSGLAAMYYALRLTPATVLSSTHHEKLRRYLRLRQVCDNDAVSKDYRSDVFDGAGRAAI